jgi:hypothetical protein
MVMFFHIILLLKITLLRFPYHLPTKKVYMPDFGCVVIPFKFLHSMFQLIMHSILFAGNSRTDPTKIPFLCDVMFLLGDKHIVDGLSHVG